MSYTQDYIIDLEEDYHITSERRKKDSKQREQKIRREHKEEVRQKERSRRRKEERRFRMEIEKNRMYLLKNGCVCVIPNPPCPPALPGEERPIDFIAPDYVELYGPTGLVVM